MSVFMQLKPPSLNKLTDRVLSCEGEAEHWSLKDRFVLANDVLDGLAAAGRQPAGSPAGGAVCQLAHVGTDTDLISICPTLDLQHVLICLLGAAGNPLYVLCVH